MSMSTQQLATLCFAGMLTWFTWKVIKPFLKALAILAGVVLLVWSVALSDHSIGDQVDKLIGHHGAELP